MGLKQFYQDLEDKYFNLLDWLEEKGIPLINVANALEDNNIPAFPVTVLVLLILIGLIGMILVGPRGIIGGTTTLTLNVLDADDNPLSNVKVNVSVNGLSPEEYTTNSEGKVLLTVPIGANLNVNVDDPEFGSGTKTFIASPNGQQTLKLFGVNTLISKRIKLLNSGDNSVFSKPVTAVFSCTQTLDYSKETTIVNGEVELTDIPSNCGALTVSVDKYQLTNNFIDLSETGSTELHLQEDERQTGEVFVQVNDIDGNPLQAITVRLYSSAGIMYDQKVSNASGTVLFEKVPLDNYYVIATDDSGTYQTSSASEKKDVLKDLRTEFSVSLELGVRGRIRIKVIDSVSGLPVANAKVTLSKETSSGKQIQGEPKYSDAEGKVEFNVADALEYKAEVDHKNYIIAEKTGLKKTDSEEYTLIELIEATEANRRTLLVSVVDEKGMPVQGAKAVLQKEDRTTVGSDKFTPDSGVVSFDNLTEGNYLVYVVKAGFGESLSDVIQVKERQLNEAKVTLVIGTGTLEVSVLDSEANPVSGAVVSVYDYFSDEKLGKEKLTDQTGKTSFSLRADKKVYLVVNSAGNLNYTTVPIQLGKEVIIKKEISLIESTSNLESKLLGLYVNSPDGLQKVENVLQPGQKYIGKFLLVTPQNASYDLIGMHIRTGNSVEGETNLMEADPWFIKNVSVAQARITKGVSYSPPNGFATDATKLTAGDSKWLNIEWKKPTPGIKEVEVELQVKDVKRNEELLLEYRGWGKGGAEYLRDPQDRELRNLSSTANKQELYAFTKRQKYTTGTPELCNQLCYSMTVEDLSLGLETAVVSEYEAKIANTYKLRFVLTNNSSSAYSGAKLNILNENAGLELQNYKINVKGKDETGIPKGNLIELNIGSLEPTEPVSGEIVFKTTKDGTNKLLFELISGKEKIQPKSLLVKVQPAKKLAVEILPKSVVPFIENQILVQVKDAEDGIEVSNALVRLTLNDAIVVTGNTDSRGLFEFTLPAPNSNSKLGIEVEKNGYQTIKKIVNITETILEFFPSSITDTLVVSGPDSKLEQFNLVNSTELPLTITKVSFSPEFSELLSFEFKDNLEELELVSKRDYNFSFEAKLKQKAKQISRPLKLQGSLDLEVTSEVLNKTWVNRIPIELRLAFGGSLDSTECLIVDPLQWNIFTANETKTLNLVVKNLCEVNGNKVALQNFEVKINRGNENDLGNFILRNESTEQEVTLSNVFQKIADLLPAESDNVYTLRFEPKSFDSATAKPKLIFRAINRTSSGDDVVEKILKVDTQINELTKCVAVKDTANLVVESCPYNIGFGAYRLYNPSSAGIPPQQLVGQTTDPRIASILRNRRIYPYPGVYPYGFNPQASGLLTCGEAQFRVENNCASTVSIRLDSHPSLNLSETRLDIEPGEDASIRVGQSIRFGQYPVKVQAKIKGSDQASVDIKELKITVLSFSQATAECIRLKNPSNGVFRFNDFLQKPVRGEIVNTCYEQGVQLFNNASQNSIEPPIKFKSYYNDADSQMVAQVIAGQIYRTTDAQGRTIEVLPFKIRKNEFYKKGNVAKQLEGLEGPIQQLAGLRGLVSQGYAQIFEDGYMLVDYLDPYQRSLVHRIDVVFEDLWLLGQYDPSEYGNLNLDTPKEVQDYCLAKLDFGTLNDLDFQDSEIVSKKIIVDVIKVEGDSRCGSQDYLDGVKINPNFEKKLRDLGLEFSLNISGNRFSGTTVIGTFKRLENFPASGLNVDYDNINSVGFKEQFGVDAMPPIRSEFTRITGLIPKTFDVELKLHFVVRPRGEIDGLGPKAREVYKKAREILEEKDLEEALQFVDNSDISDKEKKLIKKALSGSKQTVQGNAVDFCPALEGNYKVQPKLFDKLLFNWDYDKISKNTCSQDKYCDSTQLLISSLKRKKEILNKLSKVEDELGISDNSLVDTTGLNKYCLIGQDVKATIKNHKCINYLNSKDLYKIGLLQTKIVDVFTNKSKVYFLKKDFSVLEDPNPEKQLTPEVVNGLNVLSEMLEKPVENKMELIKTIKLQYKNAVKPLIENPENNVLIEFDYAKIEDDIDRLSLLLNALKGRPTHSKWNGKANDIHKILPSGNHSKAKVILTFNEYDRFITGFLDWCSDNFSDCNKDNTKLKVKLNEAVNRFDFEIISDPKAVFGYGEDNYNLDKENLAQFASSMKVKVGAENKIDVENEGGQTVYKNPDSAEFRKYLAENAGSAIDGFSFKELFDLSNYNVNLLVDGMDGSFKDDFSKTYPQQGEDIKNWILTKDVTKAGIYKVELNTELVPKTGIEEVTKNINLGKFYPIPNSIESKREKLKSVLGLDDKTQIVDNKISLFVRNFNLDLNYKNDDSLNKFYTKIKDLLDSGEHNLEGKFKYKIKHTSKVPVTSLKLSLEKEFEENPLNYLAFDGKVGLTGTDTSSRNGYGLDLKGEGGELKVNSPSQKDSDKLVSIIASETNNTPKTLLNYSNPNNENALNETKKGKLLSLNVQNNENNTGTLVLSPSLPVPLAMNIKSKDKDSVSVYYNIEEIETQKLPNPLFKWNLFGRSNFKRNLQQQEAYNLDFAGNKQSSFLDAYDNEKRLKGLTWKPAPGSSINEGSMTLSTLAFVPANAGTMHLVLSKKSNADIKIKGVSQEISLINGTQQGTSVVLGLDNVPSKLKKLESDSGLSIVSKIANNTVSIQDIAKLNSQGYLCSKKIGNELELVWNQDKILGVKTTPGQPTTGSGSGSTDFERILESLND